MIKRIFLGAALAVSAMSSIAVADNAVKTSIAVENKKIDQSSPEALAASLMYNVFTGDTQAVRQLIAPETLQKMAKQQGGDEDKAIKNYIETLRSNVKNSLEGLAEMLGFPTQKFPQVIIAALENDVEKFWNIIPENIQQEAIKQEGSKEKVIAVLENILTELRQKMIKNGVQAGLTMKTMTQINGKWYMQEPPLAVEEIKVDQTTKEGVCLLYLKAIANGDAQMMWQITSPAARRNMISTHGSQAAAEKFIKEQMQVAWKAEEALHRKNFQTNNFDSRGYVLSIIDNNAEKAWALVSQTPAVKAQLKQNDPVAFKSNYIKSFGVMRKSSAVFLTTILQSVLTQADGKWYLNFSI